MKSKTEKLLDELIKLHPKYIDLSLDRLKLLLKKLNNPHLELPQTIHIAGTNGKGSIQSYIRSILISNGYSCDSYISPHLTKFNERIILNNKEVSTKKLYKTLEFVKEVNNSNPITFFEITTAAAFVLFKNSNSNFLILETGLGGRLDATNIIPKKLCSIITPISYDHEEFLGNTIRKITNEKLGIVRNNDFTIISKQSKEVEQYIKNKLSKHNNIYYYGKNYKIKKINDKKFEFKFYKIKKIFNKPKLNGFHQIENASVALAFAEVMAQRGLKINYIETKKSIRETTWPGRIEEIKYYNKKIILDGSHNMEGANKLNDFLKFKKLKPVVVFGMLNNKKINMFLNSIKNNIENILAIKIPGEKNAFLTNEIIQVCNSLSIRSKQVNGMDEALSIIKKSKQKIFLITGSLYLIGKFRNKFL